jgi:precorrin-6B methylase 2
MISVIKRFLCKSLSLENYLRILQRGYFLAYNTGLLKLNPDYSYHYFVKNLIKNGDVVVDIGANLGYYSILFARWVGPEGKVYAVEPVRIYNTIFNEKAKKYDNIQLYPSLLFNDLKKIDYIRCDMEGFENIVLSEMKELIRRCKPKVQVEVWQENEESVFRLFNELGYFPYKLYKNELILQTGKENRTRGDYIFLPMQVPVFEF